MPTDAFHTKTGSFRTMFRFLALFPLDWDALVVLRLFVVFHGIFNTCYM